MKKVLFWTVQLTWGLLENIIGGLIFLVLFIAGYRPKRFAEMLYFEVGENLGGFNMGFVAVVNKDVSVHTLHHEHGHFIQTFFFGPFTLLIQLASAIRYWYRRYIQKTNPEKYRTLPDYDSIWFEGQATGLGYKYCNKWYIFNVFSMRKNGGSKNNGK